MDESKLRTLNEMQLKASLLIQGYSFFMSIQQEIDLRNQIKENYMSLIKQVMEVSHKLEQ